MDPEIISSPRGGIANLSYTKGSYTDEYGDTYTVYFPSCVNVHPIWKLVQVEFNGWLDHDSPYREDRPYSRGVGSLPIKSAESAYGYGFFSGRDSRRGLTYEPRNITFKFVHTKSGKLIEVKSSDPHYPSLVTSGGRLLVDL